MASGKHDKHDAAKGTPDALKAAHQRDESAQTRDIDRMSDKGPDNAEANITEAERDAHRMRTQNEV